MNDAPFCSRCGTRAPHVAALFCAKCGAAISAPHPGASTDAAQPSGVVDGQEPVLVAVVLGALKDGARRSAVAQGRALVTGQLDVVQQVLRTQEAQALGRRVLELDTAGVIKGAFAALGTIIDQQSKGPKS